jgi:hypothetical protein
MVSVIGNDATYPMVMEEFKKLYGEKYDIWLMERTKGGIMANPYPMTYAYETPQLEALYKASTELVAKIDDIGQMVDHIVDLFKICRGKGKMFYFSRYMLQLELTAETKKKVAFAYVLGMLQGRFSSHLFVNEVFDYDEKRRTGRSVYLKGEAAKIAADTAAMAQVAEETGCPAVMLVVDARYESTLPKYHVLLHLKYFAANGFRPIVGADSDFPYLVGLFRKPTTHELGIEVEYMLSRNHAELPRDKIPLWRRSLRSLTSDEEADVKSFYPPHVNPVEPSAGAGAGAGSRKTAGEE